MKTYVLDSSALMAFFEYRLGADKIEEFLLNPHSLSLGSAGNCAPCQHATTQTDLPSLR